MAETLQKNGLWHILLVENDLVNQAGLDQNDFEQDFGFFKYKGRAVIISHTYREHLVVSIEGKEDEDLKKLMDSFSKVVEYTPFCKYNLHSKARSKAQILPTYEWDKVNPKGRLDELSKKEDISDLVSLP